MSQNNSFSFIVPGRADRIHVAVRVFAGDNHYDTEALWDTGSGSSHISENIVNALSLKDYGISMCTSASEHYMTTRHIITVQVCGLATFENIIVRKLCSEVNDEDMVIGMDIIRYFDSAISTMNGRLFFSIRYPSQGMVDFNNNNA